VDYQIPIMKIIGVGFGRTGTLSTFTALNQLGYRCYYMFEVLENKANKGHLEFWHRVAHSDPGSQQDWNEVFEYYNATVDNPACCVWCELIEQYPDAKVILTLHPKGPDAWYKSTMNTIYKTELLWQFKVLAFFIPNMRKMTQMCSKLIWQRSHQGTMKDREQAIARYNEHIEQVKAEVSEDRLLLFSVDQGWEPLCTFLEKESPDNEFPKMNDTQEFQAFVNKLTWVAYRLITACAVAMVAVFYLLVKLLG
jgi:hypothetical protein